MTPASFLQVFIIFGLFRMSCSVYCYICSSPKEDEVDNCILTAECAKDSPGCITLHLGEPDESQLVFKGCADMDKCRDSFKKWIDMNITECQFCRGDLCNGSSTLCAMTVLPLFLILIRLLM